MIAVENKTCKVLKIKNICCCFTFKSLVKNYYESNENALNFEHKNDSIIGFFEIPFSNITR